MFLKTTITYKRGYLLLKEEQAEKEDSAKICKILFTSERRRLVELLSCDVYCIGHTVSLFHLRFLLEELEELEFL